MATRPPLIAHVVHALDVGGLENGLVNLINHMPVERYRHVIVCMTRYTAFRERLQRDDVEVLALQRDSKAIWRTYIELILHFRRLRPAIVHSRNLSGLDALLPARLAGVGVRVHGEHGRDENDLDGRNPKNLRLRRMFSPLVTNYCAVSRDLARYITDTLDVPASKVAQIYNGVDTEHFRPRERVVNSSILSVPVDKVVIGTVGRLQPVKDQSTLIKAFADAVRRAPELASRMHLAVVGDGPCRQALTREVSQLRIEHLVSLLGARHDVAAILRSFDLFVLPSLSEGISNTILEAMASGIPVLATRVGGNPELITENQTGQLVNSGDQRAMADWIIRYVRDGELRRRQGVAGRQVAEERFSMQAMVKSYLVLYDRLLDGRGYPAQARITQGS